MAFWNKFPYSNFHEINLDWLLREMKKISGSVSDFARQWEKALKQETGERQEADRQLQENIDAEQARAEAAEEALDQKIEAETSRAEAAEEALDQKIEAETNRAEAAEEALDQKIEAETSRAEAAEKALDDKITAETNRATEAEEALDQKIEAETSRAEAAEKALDDKITAETDRATEAEKTLDQKIDAETARATEKENDLQEQITAEVNRATEKENNLQEQITAEVNRATAAEGTLDDKIEAETTRATGVENELRGLITTETQRATAAEEELDGKITAETSRATGVENELRGLITTETERATAAEDALGDRIDGLEGELEGVTGADSPFIRKDGTTATTGKIPLAQGGTSEVDPAAATDLVNLRSMQAADQALESSMTEYVDNQLEAATGDIHSIPAGGTAGQVLAKKSKNDYDTEWVDQTGGGSGLQYWIEKQNPDPSDYPAVGVSLQPVSVGNWLIGNPHGAVVYANGNSTVEVDHSFRAQAITGRNGYLDLYSGMVGNKSRIRINPSITLNIAEANGIKISNNQVMMGDNATSGVPNNAFLVEYAKGGVTVYSNGSRGETGQVLTAKGDGTCGWADAGGGAWKEYSNGIITLRKIGGVVYMYLNQDYTVTFEDHDASDFFNGKIDNGYRATSFSVPDEFIPANTTEGGEGVFQMYEYSGFIATRVMPLYPEINYEIHFIGNSFDSLGLYKGQLIGYYLTEK